ncbi:MAG: TrbI/VirB10 family protein [Burkholderiales bacterium]
MTFAQEDPRELPKPDGGAEPELSPTPNPVEPAGPAVIDRGGIPQDLTGRSRRARILAFVGRVAAGLTVVGIGAAYFLMYGPHTDKVIADANDIAKNVRDESPIRPLRIPKDPPPAPTMPPAPPALPVDPSLLTAASTQRPPLPPSASSGPEVQPATSLIGNGLLRRTGRGEPAAAVPTTLAPSAFQAPPGGTPPGIPGAALGASQAFGVPSAAQQQGGPAMGALLRPTQTQPAVARVLIDVRYLLPKGRYIPCGNQPAIDTTFPAQIPCVVKEDVYGYDGSVKLIDRGSTIVGETTQAPRQGQRRVLALMNDLYGPPTPDGRAVKIDLNSLVVDDLGRGGIAGYTNTHLAERLLPALVLTAAQGAMSVLTAAASRGGNASVVVNPQLPGSVLTDPARQAVDIPPTVEVPQATPIMIAVQRDLDFSRVYALRPVAEASAQ